MSAAFCALFGEVTCLTWYESGAVAHLRVAPTDRLPSPSPTEWVIFASTAEVGDVMRDLTPGTPVFIVGQFHADMGDAGGVLIRVFADRITVGIKRAHGPPLFWEVAEAELPAGWLPLGAVQ
jgi:hypothetical protein